MAQIRYSPSPPVLPGEETQRGIQGYQNAMVTRSRLDTAGLENQQQVMQNQEMARGIEKRNELEAVLSQSQNPERDGYEWAKRNDPELSGKLAANYIKRFSEKARLDPKNAAAELENATGEKIEIGNRYAKLPFEGVEAYVDNFNGHVFQPSNAKEMADIRNDFAATMEAAKQEGRKELEGVKAELGSDKLKQQQGFTAGENEKDRAARLKAAQISGAQGPKTHGQLQFVTIYDEKTGLPKNYWVDPVKKTMEEASVSGGRTEPRDIAQGSQAIIQSADVTLPVLTELESDLKALDSGPLKGRLASFSLKNLGGAGLGPQEVAIRTKLGRLTADQIFGEGGKQLTVTEKTMIEPFVINQLDTLQTAMGKLPELRKRIERIKASRFSMMNPRTRAVHRDKEGGGGAAESGGGKARFRYDPSTGQMVPVK